MSEISSSRDAESAGTQRVVAHYDHENDRVVTASQMASLLNHQGKPGQAAARTYTVPLYAPTAESTGTGAKDNAVQQARRWAQEARTQRAIVLDILRYFGLPERDWEALRLIRQHIEAIAESWDGCHRNVPGEEIEIGPALRRALAPGQSFTATPERGARDAEV